MGGSIGMAQALYPGVYEYPDGNIYCVSALGLRAHSLNITSAKNFDRVVKNSTFMERTTAP